jgi:ABC-type Zn2+ transport system substrate-binding protein/surface adhesin
LYNTRESGTLFYLLLDDDDDDDDENHDENHDENDGNADDDDGNDVDDDDTLRRAMSDMRAQPGAVRTDLYMMVQFSVQVASCHIFV